MKIRKNDNVIIIAGKDRGKKGKVRHVFPKKGRLTVEGLNMIKRHSKAKGGARQAGIIEMEAPVNASNVMLICDKCGKPTRIGFKSLDNGRKARICRFCQEVID